MKWQCQNREIMIQMVVISICRWLLNFCWKEKWKICRYEVDTAFLKNTDCKLPASSSAALKFRVFGVCNILTMGPY